MQTLLQKVNRLIHEERILRREKERRGENYNVFEVMNAQQDEVHTHSAIIASLLNPKSNHGCKGAFLQLFVNNLVESIPEVANPIALDTDFDKCHVDVERYIGRISSDYETGGRIDIIVESEKRDKAIIIENKIYAEDQEKQLYRYRNYAITKYKNFIILYLSLDGHNPNKTSTTGKMFSMSNENKDFYCISYESFIRDWLVRCKEKAVSFPIVRETITQYYNLISKLTNQVMENSTREKLIDLLANKDNISALFKIRNIHYDVLNKVCNTTLIEQVQEVAKELGMLYKCPPRDWHTLYSQFFFYKPEWNHFCIGFEFMGKDLKNFNYGIRYKDKSDIGKFLDVKTEILDKIERASNFRWESNSWWASFTPFKYPNWNNDVAFERLYDGTIKAEIKKNVESLCDCLNGIEL